MKSHHEVCLVATGRDGSVLHDGWTVTTRNGEEAFYRGVTALPTDCKQAKVLVTWDTETRRGSYEYYASVFDIKVTTMTDAQLEKLEWLCGRWGRGFNPAHYRIHPEGSSSMAGWVEGWIGGAEGTLYVAVAPDGSSHS